MQSIDRAYSDLANAIILQAVTDYRNALNGIAYRRKTPAQIIKEIEEFFLSEYFKILTRVKGDYLIEQLRKEHIKNKRLHIEGG